MHSKTGLLWYELLIKGMIYQNLFQKLSPLGAGIVYTLTTATLLFPGRSVNAALLENCDKTVAELPEPEDQDQKKCLFTTVESFVFEGNVPIKPNQEKISQTQPFPPVPPENLKPNPNEDRFPQPFPIPEPLKPEQERPIQSPTRPEPPAAPESLTIDVKKIVVTGSTAFSQEQLNKIVRPFEEQSLTLEQLTEVADAITQLYLEQGYITSRAILVPQEIGDGRIEIRVIEGGLEEIRIEGTNRLNPNYVRNRIKLGVQTPLNTASLEDRLRLLRANPLFENVEASLRAGKETGKSILIVRVTEANPFEGSVSIDNYSSPSVGSERLGTNLRQRNLTGNGDEISASYYHTTRSGADIWELNYRLPVNAMNGTVQLRTSLNRNKIVDEELRILNIEGDSELYELSFRQPLLRSPREEFALSLGFAVQESQSLIGGFGFPSPGADEEGITQTSVIKFGQDYLRRDLRGAWSLRSLFSLGTGWFGATVNPNPEPDGRFLSWLGQVQRVQILSENNFLIIGTDVQLTPNSLLPSQQFVVGGGQSLRGYRQNLRARDNGVRFSLEDRITLERDESGAATFQLAPFFDASYVWNNSDNPSNESLEDTQPEEFLAGAGLGLIWQPLPKLNLRLDYALPLVENDDRGTNAQDEGFYFSVRYSF
ncbi:MAG: ShlB/FhaC/HecB family hemolysin secretion/activation protein [Coleofasciculaceae cyanobacterium]